MQTEVVYTSLSREEIKAERKVRNKLKREKQKLEKLNKKNIGRNHGVSIVSKEFVSEYRSNKDLELLACENTRNLNLEELIQSQPEKCVKPKAKSKVVVVDKYGGNRLDSAQPVRLVGKRREVPKKKSLSGLRKGLIEEERNQTPASSNQEPFNYCNNILNDSLNTAAHTFVNEVVILQEKLYKRDPNKGVIKRRYVVGFRETKKKMVVKKVKICIIAVDINVKQPNDALHTAICGVMEMADEKNIPYVFALKRRTIGNLAMKSMPISCMGVLNYDGANESFKELMEQIGLVKELYNESTKSVSEVTVAVNNLMEKLKDVIIG